MSLLSSALPLLLQELCNELNHPHALLNQYCSPYRTTNHLLTPLHHHHRHTGHTYYHPWNSTTVEKETVVKNDNGKFQVIIDVQQFQPQDISVKTTADNYIVVEAKHEERQDEHGFIMRHFIRRYLLPEDYDSKDVISSLSSDGVLTISALKKSIKADVRVVPITQTGTLKNTNEKEN